MENLKCSSIRHSLVFFTYNNLFPETFVHVKNNNQKNNINQKNSMANSLIYFNYKIHHYACLICHLIFKYVRIVFRTFDTALITLKIFQKLSSFFCMFWILNTNY